MCMKNTDPKELTYVPVNQKDRKLLTHDIELASALVCCGFILEEVAIIDKRAMFHFERHSEVPQAIEEFWNNTMRVSPLAYANTRKNLKSRIYSMM